MIDRKLLLSVPELRSRGWTTTAIAKFLPAEPDDTRENPHYSRAGAPMKFWLNSRVKRVERTKRFLAWRAGSDDRKDAALDGVRTRSVKMQIAMKNAELTIQRGWTSDRIYQLALRTHGGNYDGEPGPFIWNERTARNCIRHCLTNYEELWHGINRGTTAERAYQILRERVDKLIDEAYPDNICPITETAS